MASSDTTTIFRGGTVVTMDATRRVLAAEVWVKGDRITKIARPTKTTPVGAQVIDATGHIVLPGLIQSHVHLCQTLFRGAADDLPLLPWLQKRIWPLEAAHDDASLYASARLGLGEMLSSGTTTILDMGTVHHHDAVFQAIDESGMRAFSGKAMMDQGRGVPKGLRESTQESLAASVKLCARWDGKSNGRIRYAFAPRFILSCTEELWRKTALIAKELGVIVHSHAAEHEDERRAVKAALGVDDIAALASYGVKGPGTVLAHGVQLRQDEMKKLATWGTRIVHCPSANMKLASGIADVRAMREAGIVVGIGADGAPCNNRMDPWTEIRQAALLSKALRRDATSMRAVDALELATIDGARVLGIDDHVGSLEVGKKADLVMVRRDALHTAPSPDPVSELVYATRADDVAHVMIDGRTVVADGKLRSMRTPSIVSDAHHQITQLRKRARI